MVSDIATALLLAVTAVVTATVIVLVLNKLSWIGEPRRKEFPDSSEVPEQFADYIEKAIQLGELSDAMGWPAEWIICPACAQHSWRLPPHIFNPCPLLSQTADSMGLKLDAERMTAVRSGTAVERQLEMMEKLFRSQFGEDEDGDDE